MKKKQEMQYYLRKSAYGLAAVSVAVLAVGSPVSAQEKAASTEATPKVAPKVPEKPSKEVIKKALKKTDEETKEKEKEAKEKVENSEGSTAMVSEVSSTNEETSSEEENNTDEEETEDDPSGSDTEVENVEAINLSEAEGNDSSKPETTEELTAEDDRQETNQVAEVKTEESAKEGDEDADKKDEVEEKAKKAAELSRVKAEALAKLEALNASRLMKKIVESGKTVEGILSFMKESLPQLEAARASEQAKTPEVTQSPDHLPSEKKAVHNPVQAVKTSESLEQKAENAKTSTNLQNTQSPVQEAKRTQAQLPSTGEDYQAYLVAAAMALNASSGMVAYGSYRKKMQK